MNASCLGHEINQAVDKDRNGGKGTERIFFLRKELALGASAKMPANGGIKRFRMCGARSSRFIEKKRTWPILKFILLFNCSKGP